MGASGWHHFVPYEDDVSAALDKLRAEVFRRGAYYSRRGRKPKTLAQLEQSANEDGTHSVIDVRRVLDGTLPEPMLRWYERVLRETGSPPPDTERDQRMKAELAVVGAIGRLSEATLQHVFGTSRPDRATAERGLLGTSRVVPRGCGAVVVIYDGDRAVELLFVGKTGD